MCRLEASDHGGCSSGCVSETAVLDGLCVHRFVDIDILCEPNIEQRISRWQHKSLITHCPLLRIPRP